MADFVHNGKRYTLTHEMVERSLDGMKPQTVRQLAAGVSGGWYPVKQAFVTPLGLRNSDVNSRIAFNHLGDAGVPVHDTKVDGPLPPVPPRRPVNASSSGSPAPGGTRQDALTLAVEVLKGTPGATAEQVTEVADAFDRWLRSA